MPPSLARYMATSADHMSAAASSASWGAKAMPMLAPTWAVTPPRTNGVDSAAAMRWATATATSGSASTSTAANSSPPRRTGTSLGRRLSCRRGPSWRRSSSPAGWPKESLISLKWFRSMNKKATERTSPPAMRLLSPSEKKVSSTANMRRRLPSPVSSSVTAWRWRSRVSTRRPRTVRLRRAPTSASVPAAKAIATPLSARRLPTRRITSPAAAATPGSANPGPGRGRACRAGPAPAKPPATC